MPELKERTVGVSPALTSRFDGEVTSLDSERRRLLLEAISRQSTTRKRLATLMELRAGTVTDLVLDLLNQGLVRELEPIRSKEKGRPEIWLESVPNAVGTIVVRALSDRLSASLIDLSGDVISARDITVQASTVTAEAVLRHIAALVQSLKDSNNISNYTGIVVSLPGIVNEASGEWLFSSRYPAATPLSVSSLSDELGIEVQVQRALSAELQARILRQAPSFLEPTVLLHWGYGVGLAASDATAVQRSNQGAFGEIGHWRTFLASTEKCQCGEIGCLETQAGLWSLVTPLNLSSSNEEAFAQRLLQDPTLADHHLIRRATSAMAIAMRDVYLMLFPDLIAITGPFVQSPIVFKRLIDEFHARLPHFAPAKVRFEVAALNPNDEIFGAAKPLLHSKLCSLLDRSS